MNGLRISLSTALILTLGCVDIQDTKDQDIEEPAEISPWQLASGEMTKTAVVEPVPTPIEHVPTGPQGPTWQPQDVESTILCDDGSGDPLRPLMAVPNEDRVMIFMASGNNKTIFLPLPDVHTLGTETSIKLKGDRILASSNLAYVDQTYLHLNVVTLMDADGNEYWSMTQDWSLVDEMWLAADDSAVLKHQGFSSRDQARYISPTGEVTHLERFQPQGPAVGLWVPGHYPNADWTAGTPGWLHVETAEFVTLGEEFVDDLAVLYEDMWVGVGRSHHARGIRTLKAGARESEFSPLFHVSVDMPETLEIVDFNPAGWLLLHAGTDWEKRDSTTDEFVRVRLPSGDEVGFYDSVVTPFPEDRRPVGCYEVNQPNIDNEGTILVGRRSESEARFFAYGTDDVAWKPVGAPFTNAGEMKVNAWNGTLVSEVTDVAFTFCAGFSETPDDWPGAVGTHKQLVYRRGDAWNALIFDQSRIYVSPKQRCAAVQNTVVAIGSDGPSRGQSIVTLMDLETGAEMATIARDEGLQWF
jgi:hypothetical protein